MKRHDQHIALLLLLFFGYSILFQNLHILLHDHGDSHANCILGHRVTANFCVSDNGCGHSSGCNHQDNNSEHPGHPEINNPDYHSHDAASCLVCEHEFAKFSIAQIFNIDFSAEAIGFVTPCHYQAPRILYNGNHISLRAPPSVS